MNRAADFFTNVLANKLGEFNLENDKEKVYTLMKEASKVESVLDTMDFCTEECAVKFASDFNPDSDAQCFNSCVSKSFEMKQLEGYYRSIV